jgi:hypothetical protein
MVTSQFGRNWGSIVGIVTSCRLDSLGSSSGRERKCLDWLWSLPSLLFSGYQGSFLGVHGQGMKLTTLLHLVPRLRMNGAVPLLLIYAFIAWTRKTLHFCINLDEFIKWVVRIKRGIFLFTN